MVRLYHPNSVSEHCRNVGRDYDSILKTKLGVVVIGDNKELARKGFQQVANVPEEQVNEFVIYGTPEDVLRQIELLEETGIQYFIMDLDPSKELEALDIFAKEIIKKS